MSKKLSRWRLLIGNLYRILAIKAAPTILYTGLTAVIGKPEDYATNKNNGSFPDSYDIRIPLAPRAEP